jgi:glycosyltransferase involved in cell wall biosynthesis
MKRNTLVIVTPGFPANEQDSTCLPPRQAFVKALSALDPTLRIIVLSIRYPFFSKHYKWNGVEVISFGGQQQSRIARLFAYFRILLTLRRLKYENNIVGLLSFWLDKSALIANFFAKKNKLPHFCWLLGQDAAEGNKYVKLMKPNGAYLIALSDFISREFKKNYNITPHYIIPVGIAENSALITEQERSIDILGVGSLIELKQYDVFIKVIKELVQFFPNIKVNICGDGPEKYRLNQLISNLALTSNISLLGPVKHEEVIGLMQQSKLLLHTSRFEGFGTVNLEALSAGAKVISFVKPMDVDIENWYHADNAEEMILFARSILADPAPVYKSVVPFAVSQVAMDVYNLFIGTK